MVLFMLLSCFPVYAAATPSNADPDIVDEDIPEETASDADRISEHVDELLKGLDYDELDEMERLELFELYIQSLSGPGTATASNASIQSIESYVKDIHAQIVPAPAEVEEDLVSYALEGDPALEAFALVPDFSLDRNVVIYEGVFDGQSARLVLPCAVASTLFIDDAGYLYNVGLDNVTGRLFYADFDPLDYEINAFTLTPCLGNNASTLYNNRYPSYNRYYYESGSRLNNTTVYGLFQVTDVVHTPSDLPVEKNGIYLLVLILIGGVCVLCLWKRS